MERGEFAYANNTTVCGEPCCRTQCTREGYSEITGQIQRDSDIDSRIERDAPRDASCSPLDTGYFVPRQYVVELLRVGVECLGECGKIIDWQMFLRLPEYK